MCLGHVSFLYMSIFRQVKITMIAYLDDVKTKHLKVYDVRFLSLNIIIIIIICPNI